MRKIINDGVEASTRISRARFQIISQSLESEISLYWSQPGAVLCLLLATGPLNIVLGFKIILLFSVMSSF